ncbi:transmembrane protein, putative (macronuclear) [Tetrahymena thermophila SB210]|uniref:Transmembrane protein, putative n=1 Tax=Tetrahymena thermophila (strain SB210) TaxID=312017 RepID=Q22YA2_TETTS|nr:transmembrane protein, putative [Tetrahymena thermophila SB210]EAR90122.2 transmembrane protein, putative [Tetrahymena thermophila SB210]|eukprot:XP_001010367.2 transmembrane protein, putative [Tetrahymena thermophila SB210]
MSKIQDLFRSIDIYGQRIDINFQNKQVYKTIYGGAITFIIGIFFIVGCWFFGDQLINRRNPSVIFSERYVEQAQRINITSDNLIIMFGVSDKQSQLWVDPTIFQLRAVQQILQLNNNTQNGQYERKLISVNKTIKICDQSDIGIPEVYNYFSKLSLNKLFCFEKGQDLYMQGDFDAQQFAQLYVYIEKCQNNTSEVVCQPIDVINQKLQLINIDMFLSNTIIDPLNYSNPFSFRGMNQYSSASSVFPKELQLYYTNYYIQDDVGLLYTQKEEKHKFLFTGKQETTYFGDYNVLARILIRIQKTKENLMQRRYQKIQDVIAQMGGLLKILFLVGSFIVFPFSSLIMYKAIGDNIFLYKTTDYNQQPQNKIQIHQNNKVNLNDFSQMNLNLQNQLMQNSSKKINESNSNQLYQQQQQQQNSIYLINQNGKSSNKKITEKKQLVQQSTDKNLIQDNKQKKIKVIQQNEEQKTEQSSKINSYQSISYSFFDYFKSIFCFKKTLNDQKSQLVQNGINQVKKQLDVIYLINKLQEIDKLKSVLLDKDQIKLFDSIPKQITLIASQSQNPVKFHNLQECKSDSNKEIYDKSGKEKSFSYNKSQQNQENQQNQIVLQALQNIVKKQHLTQLDYRLFDMIDCVNFGDIQISQKQQNLLETKPIPANIPINSSTQIANFQSPKSLSDISQIKISLFQKTSTNSNQNKPEQSNTNNQINSNIFIYNQMSSKINQEEEVPQIRSNLEDETLNKFNNSQSNSILNQEVDLEISTQNFKELYLEESKAKYNPNTQFKFNTINSIKAMQNSKIFKQNFKQQ